MSQPPAQTASQRILSLDVFRGMNLALMIFVNELAEIKGLPWWTYHAPGRVDAMLVGFHWWSEHFSSGTPGVVRALVFTAAMVGLSALLTKMRVRLQL